MRRRAFISTVALAGGALSAFPQIAQVATMRFGGISVLWEPDALAYFARITANGGTIDPSTQTAVNAFLRTLKNYGLRPQIKRLNVFAGGQLAAAQVPLIADAGDALETWHGIGESQFSPTGGINVGDGNSSKYITTNLIPSSSGISQTDFSFGLYNLSTTENYGGQMGPGTGAESVASEWFAGSSIGMASGGSIGVPSGKTFEGFSAGVGSYRYASRYLVTSPTGLTLGREVNLFRYQTFAAIGYGSGGIGMYWVGNGLTDAQMRVLYQATETLIVSVGRVSASQPNCIIFGDSIAYGQGSSDNQSTGLKRWGSIVSSYFSQRQINIGYPFSGLSVSNGNFYTGFQRYGDIFNLSPARVVILYGTNDIHVDTTPGGNNTTVATFQSRYSSILSALISFGISPANIIVGSPPYTDEAASDPVKQAKYVAASQAAAAGASVKYTDVYTIMLNNGAGALLADGTHPNDAGHAVIATAFESAL